MTETTESTPTTDTALSAALHRALEERDHARKEAETAKKALAKIARGHPASASGYGGPSPHWGAERLAAEALAEIGRLRSRGAELGRLHKRLDLAAVPSHDADRHLSVTERVERLLGERLHTALSVGNACGTLWDALGNQVGEAELRTATQEELDQATAPTDLLCRLASEVHDRLRGGADAVQEHAQAVLERGWMLSEHREICIEAGLEDDDRSTADLIRQLVRQRDKARAWTWRTLDMDWPLGPSEPRFFVELSSHGKGMTGMFTPGAEPEHDQIWGDLQTTPEPPKTQAGAGSEGDLLHATDNAGLSFGAALD